MNLKDLEEMGNVLSTEDLIEILNNYYVELEASEDEQLVDDYISIAGYTEEEAYLAVSNLKKYDNL